MSMQPLVEAALREAPVAVQKFLAVPKAVALRLLSRRCLHTLDEAEEFWLALLSRLGLLELYRRCVPLPELRAHFLHLLLSETVRWQLFRYSRLHEYAWPRPGGKTHTTLVTPGKLSSSRAPRIARSFGVPHRCPTARCVCDTGARMLLHVSEISSSSRGLHVDSTAVEIIDDTGCRHRADHRARQALPRELAGYGQVQSTAPLARLDDGALCFVWRKWETRRALDAAAPRSTELVAVSVHLPLLPDLPYLRHLHLPPGETVVSIGGCSAAGPIVVGCVGGAIYLFPPGDAPPERIWQSPDGRSSSNFKLSGDGRFLAFRTEVLQGRILERRNEGQHWRQLLAIRPGWHDSRDPILLEWDLESGADLVEGSGNAASLSLPKSRGLPPRAEGPSPALVGEGVCVFAMNLLCFPIFGSAECDRVFPEGAPRLFQLQVDATHDVELHYFPPEGPYSIEPFPADAREALLVVGVEPDAVPFEVAPTPAGESPGTRRRDEVVVTRSSELPPFVWRYRIGVPCALYRWRGRWVACVRNVVRLFKVLHFSEGPRLLIALTGHNQHIYCADLDYETDRLITVDRSETAILWDLCKGKKITSYDLLELPSPDAEEEDEGDPKEEASSDSSLMLSAAPSADAQNGGADYAQVMAEADFPQLVGEQPAVRPSVWATPPALLRQSSAEALGEIGTPFDFALLDGLGKGRSSNDPAELETLARALNITVEQLLETHAAQALWDSAAAERRNTPRSRAAERRPLITSVARELATHFIPEKLWEDNVLNAPDAASRRAAGRTKLSFSIKHALRQLNVRDGCVTSIWLTQASLAIFCQPLNRLQLWCFLDEETEAARQR